MTRPPITARVRLLPLAGLLALSLVIVGPWTLAASAEQARSGEEVAEQAPANVDGGSNPNEDEEQADDGAGGGIRLVSGVAGLLLLAAGVILVYRPLNRGGADEDG